MKLGPLNIKLPRRKAKTRAQKILVIRMEHVKFHGIVLSAQTEEGNYTIADIPMHHVSSHELDAIILVAGYVLAAQRVAGAEVMLDLGAYTQDRAREILGQIATLIAKIMGVNVSQVYTELRYTTREGHRHDAHTVLKP